MTKTDFIDYIKPILKEMGYRKTRTYWHRTNGELISCIFVQGSQWDKNSYYVEVGWALTKEGQKAPTLLNWCARARVGGVNPSAQMLLDFLDGTDQINAVPLMLQYLQKSRTSRIIGQYWFSIPL